MGLLDEVDIEEQKEKMNVIYDLDGVIYLSAYKYRETEDIELMYADLFMRIHSIESELWKQHAIDKSILSLTSQKNFRDELSDIYKADRKPKPVKDMTDKQLEAHTQSLKLKELVSKVKALLHKRLASSVNMTVMVDTIQEADDRCIDYANKGWLVVAMDSDVVNQSRSPVFNYHSKHWKWVHDGLDDQEIFNSIIHSTITGGHNGDFGIKGKGKVFADKFIEQLDSGEKFFQDWLELFTLPEEALLNYRVACCSQVHDNKLKLVEIKDIADMFDTYYASPF